MKIPTIKVLNGKRVKIVNVSDLAYAVSRGYKPESEVAPEAPVSVRKKTK